MSFQAVVQRIRKAAEQRPAAATVDIRKHFRISGDLLEDHSDGAQEFVAQAAGLLLVPSEGVVEVRSRQRPDDHVGHLRFPSRDVVEYLAPGSSRLGFALVSIKAFVEDGFVLLRDGECVRAGVLGDGVPDVLDELEALGNAKLVKVKRGSGAHESRLAS